MHTEPTATTTFTSSSTSLFFYRRIAVVDDPDGGFLQEEDQNSTPPAITVDENTMMMTATTRTAHLERKIPSEEEGGFALDDFLATADLLGCSPMQLCLGLVDAPGNGGISPELIAELLLVVYGRTVTATISGAGLDVEVREMTANDEEVLTIKVIPQLTAVDTANQDGAVCVICMESSATTPSPSQQQNQEEEEKEEKEWSTAAGCDTHRFHTACIRLWTGGSCPSCRAPFRVW